MTDREIIDQIKRDIMFGCTTNFLNLVIEDVMFFGIEKKDIMMQCLFDLSLSKTIVEVHPHRTTFASLSAYNGSMNPIVGYGFVVKDSPDHQTNITPRLMKFIEVIFAGGWIEKFARPQLVERADVVDGDGKMFHSPSDPWEALEAYLDDED